MRSRAVPVGIPATRAEQRPVAHIERYDATLARLRRNRTLANHIVVADIIVDALELLCDLNITEEF